MNEANLGILLTMKDEATPQLKGFSSQLTTNRMALRELAMGVMFLGTAFISLGASMRQSNDEGIRNIGTIIMTAGAFMTAIGSAVQFIAAITKIIHALKALQIQQIITQALSGPMGWATLAAGAAIAGGAIYGVSRMASTSASSAGGARQRQDITVQNKIYLDGRQLEASTRKQIVLTQQRNAGSGIR